MRARRAHEARRSDRTTASSHRLSAAQVLEAWKAEAAIETRNEAYARAASLRLFRHLCATPGDVSVAIEHDLHHNVSPLGCTGHHLPPLAMCCAKQRKQERLLYLAIA